MKKTLVKSLALAFVGSLLLAGSALALPQVSGEINLTGSFQPMAWDGTANTVSTLGAATYIDFNDTVLGSVGDASGDFSALAFLNNVVTMNDFQFSPVLAPNPVAPLWSTTIGDINGGGFAFNMDSITVVTHNASELTLRGTGTLTAAGFDTTIGSWLFTSQDADGQGTSRLTWSSNQVPEPATMLLLGTGLVGLAGARRRKAQK